MLIVVIMPLVIIVSIVIVIIVVHVMLVDGDATGTAATEQLADRWAAGPGRGVGVTADNGGGTTTLNLRNKDAVALGVGCHRV
jgi:hypothetical protein